MALALSRPTYTFSNALHTTFLTYCVSRFYATPAPAQDVPNQTPYFGLSQPGNTPNVSHRSRNSNISVGTTMYAWRYIRYTPWDGQDDNDDDDDDDDDGVAEWKIKT
ncbi:hypothetical protein H2248_001351 [Termitomyces sp. 'cryptogamus']|nr:hypothetical protein H2248_001351 [Termitomyces sp. 'cryptogamus']